MYDIIGDIHGHYAQLTGLLKKLDYIKKKGVMYHPERKAIFVGDIINRGPQIRDTVRLVRNMVEAGNAQAIIGNHELNAILFSTMDKTGKYLGKHTPQYKLPLMRTLEEYKKFQSEWIDTVKWFRHLPVYIDLGQLRIVHGSWNDNHIATYNEFMGDNSKMKKSFLKDFLRNDLLNLAVNNLIRGVEMQLPQDMILRDDKGISRRKFRVRWWEPMNEKTFKHASFGNKFQMPDYTIPPEITPTITAYPDHAPIVFTGHYCLGNKPLILKPNICCVDSCIARHGILTAYRWNGESVLKPENIVQFGNYID